MQCHVIIGQTNGIYRALIPYLSWLSAEGATREEALQNVRQAAFDYLSRVEITTIELPLPQIQPPVQALRPDSPQALLQIAGAFKGDEEAMLQHIEEIYAERRRQKEEVIREIEEEERQASLQKIDERAA